MLAIDTNVVVRYLTGDDPVQAALAKAVIERREVFVCTTILLETEWVLRGAYGFPAAAIVASLTAFAGLPHVTLEDPDLAAQALSWTQSGMDFADAVHLARSVHHEGFLTFDRRLVAQAARLAPGFVRAP